MSLQATLDATTHRPEPEETVAILRDVVAKQ